MKILLRGFAVLYLALAGTVPAQVVIPEFMALNGDTLEDDDGTHSDWIELLNTGTAAVDLGGWSLSDRASNPRAWVFPAVTLAPGARMLVYASGENRRDAGAPLHTNFKLSGEGEYLGLTKPDGTTAYAYAPKYPPQITDISYGLAQAIQTVPLSCETAAVRYRLPDNGTLGLTWTAREFDDAAWATAAQGLGFETLPSEFAPFISATGNLLGTMYGRRSSIFVRIPFTVSDPSAISGLKLRMRYDDGFVAWVNGVEVADNLAPETDPLPWNAAATGERPDAQSIVFEEHTVSGTGMNLRAGTNVLAVQLMNRAAGNADALLQTQILAETQSFDPAGAVYFPLPTPGGVNNAGTRNPGPIIQAATSVVPQPVPGAGVAIPVTATVVPSFNPVAAVALKYRVMYGAEVSLPMLDDGTGGDILAGDGIHSAMMTPTLTAGQMLRWRVVANDTEGTITTSPPYQDPLDSPQYWGTVAADPALAESRLPVFQWFLPPGANPDTDAGARISVFYLGEFYDNIGARARGRSTRNFPKKGHNLDFNRNARFLWQADQRRVKDVDLITNWADKSHVRLTTAFEVCRLSGLPAHFAFPVRVQRNGAFHGIFDMVEDGDDRYLERAGLDPEGALYKFKEYNHLRAPVAGYVKKTREAEADTELVNLVAAIAQSRPLADRRRYAYDFLDLPAIVNYHAVCVILGHRDQGGKNFYVYRDTNRTQQWQFLPWDLDLTLGHTFTYSGTTSWGTGFSGQGYFDDDIDSQQILRIGWDNPVKQILWNVPELHQMFLRRVKTLADQFIGPAAAPSDYFPRRIGELLDQLDPPGTTGLTDAELDFRKWGFWVDGSNSSTVIGHTDSRAVRHRIRPSAARIITTNEHPAYPGSAEYPPFFPVDGVPLPVRNLNSLPAWLPGRRDFLYTPGAALSGTLGLPPSQSAAVNSLEIGDMEVNPGIAGQDGEFFTLRNTGTQAVDLSGWKLTGAVDYVFPGGCVIPAAGTAPVGVLTVTREIAAFRSRTAGPRGGEFRLVVGGYNGQLSARGETIELRRPDGSLALSQATPVQPTPLQQFLRVSALLYAPAPVSGPESLLVPQAQEEDFEWIELLNTGATPLDLSGARFIEGITLTLAPGSSLAPGQRALVVGQLAAFRARYGPGPNVIGEFGGNLNNTGEQLHLVDAAGESVLEFRYDPDWSAAADALGHALMVRAPLTTPFSAWDATGTWAPGLTPSGTPGEAAAHGMGFGGWQSRYFSAAEVADPGISGPLADPDQDGLVNAVEYMADLPPRLPGSGLLTIHRGAVAGMLQFDFPHDPLAVDALVSFEQNENPSAGSWLPVVPATNQVLPEGGRRVSFPAGAARGFIRLKVELP